MLDRVRGAYSNIHVVGHDVSFTEVCEQGVWAQSLLVARDNVTGGKGRSGTGVLDNRLDDHELGVSLGGDAQVEKNVLGISIRPVVQDITEDKQIGRTW